MAGELGRPRLLDLLDGPPVTVDRFLDRAATNRPGSGLEGCYLVHADTQRIGDLMPSDSAATTLLRYGSAEGGCLSGVGSDVWAAAAAWPPRLPCVRPHRERLFSLMARPYLLDLPGEGWMPGEVGLPATPGPARPPYVVRT